MAISRLMLDNFPHIKAYWVMLGHQDRAGRPVLRGRRPRRHGRPRDDLPRGRRRDPAGDHRGRDPAPHPRGGPRPGRARHAVSSRRAVRVDLGLARAHRRAGAWRWRGSETGDRAGGASWRSSGRTGSSSRAPITSTSRVRRARTTPTLAISAFRTTRTSRLGRGDRGKLPGTSSERSCSPTAILPGPATVHPDGHYAIGADTGIYWDFTDPPAARGHRPGLVLRPERPAALGRRVSPILRDVAGGGPLGSSWNSPRATVGGARPDAEDGEVLDLREGVPGRVLRDLRASRSGPVRGRIGSTGGRFEPIPPNAPGTITQSPASASSWAFGSAPTHGRTPAPGSAGGTTDGELAPRSSAERDDRTCHSRDRGARHADAGDRSRRRPSPREPRSAARASTRTTSPVRLDRIGRSA